MKTRTFEDSPATRSRVPLLVGLVGPSGSGKTYSALRLATGIQSVAGGEIFVIDTEARRSLHYASTFKFRHLPFGAPFSPLDYLAAIEHCVAKGAGTIVVDSMSHEHEGPGGVLEMHEAETARLAALWGVKPSVAQMSAWSKPKQERRRLINTILQLPVNMIFCFRAKEKLRIKKGQDPLPLGWMPIAGEEFVYEMGVNALLLPGALGVPTWRTEEVGERQMIKLPEWGFDIFREERPLDEKHGAALATWSAGTVVRAIPELIVAYATCGDPATLGSLESDRLAAWKLATKEQKALLKTASEAATKRVKEALERPPIDESALPVPEDDRDPETGERIPSQAELDALAAAEAARLRSAS